MQLIGKRKLQTLAIQQDQKKRYLSENQALKKLLEFIKKGQIICLPVSTKTLLLTKTKEQASKQQRKG